MSGRGIFLVLVLAMLLPSVPLAGAVDGSFLPGSQVQLHGPLVDKVLISVYYTDSSMQGAVAAGTIQAPEWTFSTGAYTSLGSNPDVIENSTVSYSWFGLNFNTLKAPGSNVHFRRAVQYLQDYSYIQTTILNGVEGIASPDVLPCPAYGGACNPMDGGNASVKSYSFNLTAAAAELLAGGFFCDGCSASNANSSTHWFYDSLHTSALFPTLWRRTTHHRDPWGARMSFEASQIGLALDNRLCCFGGGIGGAFTYCYAPLAHEIITPGQFQGTTGALAWQNSPQVVNSTVVASVGCDMYTFGFIGGPDYDGTLQEYNSQFSGTPTNLGNFENQSVNIATNHVSYAHDRTTAEQWARNFAVDYSQQLPTVMGYFENQLFAENANGWTGFALLPTQSPNEAAGLYYTLLNVHMCGVSSCDIGGVGGGQPGGTFALALQQVADQDGLNPLYQTAWSWQRDVWGEFYDSPLVVPPRQANVQGALEDYLTTSHSISSFTGPTPSGKGSFDYQAIKGPQQHAAANIVNGERIRFVFANNITFSDGVPLTAVDYQFSLDAWNVAGSPNYPDSASPMSNILGGPLGLISSNVVDRYTIDIYLNISSFWNEGRIVLPILPQHIWKYFNLDHVSTISSTLDTTKPFFFPTGAYETQGSPHPSKWLRFLNNLEVGSGPFWLRTWDTPSGTGEIDRNQFYFRSAWYANLSANQVSPGTPYLFRTTLVIPIYNPTGSTYCGVSSGATGLCQLKGMTNGLSMPKLGKVLWLYTAAGALVRKYNLHINLATGVYSAAIDTSSLTPGDYRTLISSSYIFQGLRRTWSQSSGFRVS